jgi:hypothetical protein
MVFPAHFSFVRCRGSAGGGWRSGATSDRTMTSRKFLRENFPNFPPAWSPSSSDSSPLRANFCRRTGMAAAIPGSQQSPFNGGSAPGIGDVSALQKSISAVSGAFLTSLLVTPLDVVRVRLQAQQPTIPTPSNGGGSGLNSTARLGYSTLGGESKLGVTTCCREVFFSRSWVNGTGSAIQCEYNAGFASPVLQSGYCAAEETGKRTFQGTWEGLVKIARYEGVTSLWRGLSPTLYALF